jgi:hypothetical protein
MHEERILPFERPCYHQYPALRTTVLAQDITLAPLSVRASGVRGHATMMLAPDSGDQNISMGFFKKHMIMITDQMSNPETLRQKQG